MNILIWLVLGFVAGWLASVVMKTDYRQGAMADIVMGIIGAMIGGFIFNFFGQAGVSGFNLYSVLVATVGAVVLIWIGRLLKI